MASLLTPSAMAAAPDAFFEQRIRPLLIEHCYDCHSEGKKIKGGLRLDIREGWQNGGDSGPAIIPHHPGQSLLLKAVGYKDRDLKMPPKNPLPAADRAALEQWIASGAHDPRAGNPAATPSENRSANLKSGRAFWSFQLPRQHPSPNVQDVSWPRSDIDRFILAKLEQHQLSPAPDASLHTLVRRLYFDLIGRPPTPQEWQDFHQTAQPPNTAAGIESLVDKLLASPQFGEHWGRHWLDLARFAESSGGGRTLPFKDAWRYRDYVIDSINADVPLDRFITEQIAGDLLPYEDIAQRHRHLVATGFLALGPTNYEEQDKGVLRMDIVDEQLETIGRGLLGMTLSCARCHDHKFDPVPIRDYYALAGILRSTRTLKNETDNVARWIETPLPLDPDVEALHTAYEAKLTNLENRLASTTKQLRQQQHQANPSRSGKAIAAETLPGLVVDDSAARRVGFWKSSQRDATFIGNGYLSDDNREKGNATLTFAPAFAKSGVYEVRLAYQPHVDRSPSVPVTIFHADGEETLKIDQRQPPPIDERFVSMGQYRFDKGGDFYVLLSNEGTQGYVTADAVLFIPVEELDDLPLAAAKDEEPELHTLKTTIQTLRSSIDDLKKNFPSRPEAMTVRDEDQDRIGDSPIHIRGSIRNLGAVVPRGFLSAALHEPPPLIPPSESGRRQLAAWLVSSRNPLTARVLVNRAWMWLFDEGLVRSIDNFGTTGEPPSHPELLDSLAVQFMQNGWRLKPLLKRLVLSRAYQMASQSEIQPATFIAQNASDPDNRLLWRQHRKRLPAEAIRDAILQLSGTLDLRLGSPGFSTTTRVNANSGFAQDLEYSHVFTDTRRSVYTPAFRNQRLDLFDAFDFSDINQPLGKRSRSAVSTQALYMLNHPFVLEQSRLAATALLSQASPDTTDAILFHRACLAALGRPPRSGELDLALNFLQTSAATPSSAHQRLENWTLLWQTLFASLDFRHLN